MEEITIDGINVSKCKFFIPKLNEDEDVEVSNICGICFDLCEKYNCYYKQLQKLKQKCEYIKQKAEMHKGYSPFAKMCFEELERKE